MNRFCKAVAVEDYHDFDLICDAFVGMNLQYEEIGTATYDKLYYVGIVYNGTSPGPGEISDVLNESGIKLDE